MITFFIGAGASNPFGYPTTADFFEIAGKHFAGDPLFSDMVSFLKPRHNTIDIEVILWEIDKFLKSLDSIDEERTYKKYFFMESNRGNYSGVGQSGKLGTVLGSVKRAGKSLQSDVNKLVYDTYWHQADSRGPHALIRL